MARTHWIQKLLLSLLTSSSSSSSFQIPKFLIFVFFSAKSLRLKFGQVVAGHTRTSRYHHDRLEITDEIVFMFLLLLLYKNQLPVVGLFCSQTTDTFTETV